MTKIVWLSFFLFFYCFSSFGKNSPANGHHKATLVDGYTIAQLRALTNTQVTTDKIFLCNEAGKEGFFQYDAADTTTPDNLGTVVVTTPGSKRLKRMFDGIVSVKWFGAVGDGSTDDTTPIQAALNLANGGKSIKIIFPDGNYKVTSGLTMYSKTQLSGLGKATLVFDDFNGYGITSTASFTDTVDIAANIAEDMTQFIVASGQGSKFIVNKYIYLEETEEYPGLANFNFTGTFIGRVVAVSGDTVKVDKPIPYAFTTTNNPNVFYFGVSNSGFFMNNEIKDLAFECTTTTPSNLKGFISLNKNMGALIYHNSFKNCIADAVYINVCYNTTIEENYFENIRSSSGSSISVYRSSNINIKGNHIQQSCFGITASNSYYVNASENNIIGFKGLFDGRGIKFQYNTRNSSIINNKITNTGRYGIYIADSQKNTVAENNLYLCGKSGQSSITVGGYLTHLFDYNIVTDNTIYGDKNSYGILIYADGAGTRNTFANISNNIVRNTLNAVAIFTSSNTITGNIINNYASTGTGISVALGAVKNTIANNTIQNDSTGTALITTSSGGNNFISANNTKGETVSIKTTDNVVRFGNTGKSTQSGNGSATSFTIAHGLGITPTYTNVNAGSNAAKNIAYITVDATNITVTYATAPASGTNNLVFFWEAKL